jgi:hypothetical protein
MKKLFLIIFVALSLNVMAQNKTDNKINAVQTKDGNFKAVTKAKQQPVLTGQTYTDTKGKTYPVYKSSNNKLFIVRTSKKTGNRYKYYLKTN